MASWSGTPPTTSISGMTPWLKSPSYDFSSRLYSYLNTLIGQPTPRWGGFGKLQSQGQRQNPFIDDRMKLAERYMNMGMPTVFNQAVGTLGRFANPSFMNPVARMQLGTSNYFGDEAIPPPG